MAQMLRVIQEGTKVLDFYCLRIAYYIAGAVRRCRTKNLKPAGTAGKMLAKYYWSEPGEQGEERNDVRLM